MVTYHVIFVREVNEPTLTASLIPLWGISTHTIVQTNGRNHFASIGGTEPILVVWILAGRTAISMKALENFTYSPNVENKARD